MNDAQVPVSVVGVLSLRASRGRASLPPQGELCVSSAGTDMLRSSA